MDQDMNVSIPIKSSSINIRGMIKWCIYGFFIGATLSVFVVPFSSKMALTTLIVSIIIFGIVGAKSKTKEEKVLYASSVVINNDGLTKNQKIIAWVFSILNPVITGYVMYYIWKNEYPTKARQANHISIIVFIIEMIIIGVIIGILSNGK